MIQFRGHIHENVGPHQRTTTHPPNNTIAIEDEDVHIGEQILRRPSQFEDVGTQRRGGRYAPTRRRAEGEGPRGNRRGTRPLDAATV